MIGPEYFIDLLYTFENLHRECDVDFCRLGSCLFGDFTTVIGFSIQLQLDIIVKGFKLYTKTVCTAKKINALFRIEKTVPLVFTMHCAHFSQ